MAQLMQVSFSKIIDKRIAKFSTKNSPLKQVFNNKEPRNVKLQPIEALVNLKTKNSLKFSTSPILEKIKIKAYNSVINEENPHEIDLGDIKNPHVSPDEFKNQITEQNYERLESRSSSKKINSQKTFPSVDKSYKSLIFESETLWKNIAAKLSQLKSPFSYRYNWLLYKCWRKTLTRGVNNLADLWRRKINSIVTIQKTWKMMKFYNKFKEIVRSQKIIANYWKNVRVQRKKFLALKKIVFLLQPVLK